MDASTKSWHCHMCTYLNDEDSSNCAVCNAERENEAEIATTTTGQQEAKTSDNKELENLKQTCAMIMNAFRDEEHDITRALQNYKYILHEFHANTSYDNECREYLRDHFIEDSCIALMKREHHYFSQDWNMADEINNCCKLLVSIAVPLIKDDSHLAMQIIYYCMNASNPFFRRFGHDWVK